MIQSAYVHIPFCKSKCKYCSFVSYLENNRKKQKEYVEVLLKEIDFFYKNELLKTLYIGGGTPSLLECEDLNSIVKRFSYSQKPEITLEVNPETVNFDKLAELKEIGFNRISIGVQSFDDNILKSIGRIHTSKKAVQAVQDSFEAGFDNISTDFIYGLPLQTLESFCKDLNFAAKLGVAHISLYGLKIEKGCFFYENPPENIACDDLQADMYLAAVETLAACGYEHYEISNFSKKGLQSIHNMNYWNDMSYYGFGAAAHGYDSCSRIRYENYSPLDEYKDRYKQKASSIFLSNEQMLEETIFLGFRRADGIDIVLINKLFNIDFEKKYERIIKKFLSSGHLIKTKQGYKLSNEGFLLSNIILSEFLC